VLASSAAVIGLAVPAHGDPSGDDADFLAALERAGVPYTDGHEAVAGGKDVCGQLDHGLSAMDVVKNVTDGNPGLTQDNAAKFTALAADAYCPQHLQESAPGIRPEFPWPGLPHLR
jgi:hypothetical protein